jgi:hypothetical protein
MRPHFILIYFFLFSFSLTTESKIDPPNYNFSLDQLAPFYPGASLKDLEQKVGEGDLVRKTSSFTVKKFFITHVRYKFPVIITTSGDLILDMYTVLPSFFLHDVFHQSLINRYGKQDTYKLFNGTALYGWNNKSKMKLYYSSTCTITCFPLYFSATTTDPAPSGFMPMIQALNDGHL